MTKKYSPFQITFFWMAAVFTVGLIIGVITNSNASGGEQKLFTYIVYSLAIALVGVILINTSTLFFYSSHSIKTRLLSLSFIVVSFIFLYPLFKGVVGSQYDTVEKTRYVGSDKIDIKIEYYISNDTSRIIRSWSYWKNGKKDSIWTIYDRNGNIVKKEKYNDGQLIETIK